jgi:murein DD-endopeptidase MepM/ murein hydrolase activator NlpD
MTQQEIQRALLDVMVLLESGQEQQALADLRRVLQSEPAQKLALHLQAQITEDPTALFGRESFAYTVQPGETLSRIAQRFLNDVHAFYGLARYNNIRVPRSLAGGQVLRIPGKAPPPAAAGAGSPGPAAAAGPAAPEPGAAEAAARRAEQAMAQKKAEEVARHTRAARAAFAKQDLDGALKAWNAVLALEPDNKTALLEKQRVAGLKERLQQVK